LSPRDGLITFFSLSTAFIRNIGNDVSTCRAAHSPHSVRLASLNFRAQTSASCGFVAVGGDYCCRYAMQMLQDVSDTSNISVNSEYEAAIEESYWKSVHRLKKKGRQGDGLAPSWQLENLQGDAWQERWMS
jgi:hypothetical protein